MDFSSLPKYPNRPPKLGVAPEPPPNANASIARFRIARWGVVCGFLLFVPLMALGSALGLSFAVPWFVTALILTVSTLVVYSFSCPHCGKTFARKWNWQNPFAQKCVHCGYRLPRGSEGTPKQSSR